MIDTDRGIALMTHARETIAEAVTADATPDPSLETSPDGSYGIFVTLKQQGSLRGCKGFSQPVAPLRSLTETAAVDAAVNDPRFPSLVPSELDTTTVSTTVLSPPTTIETSPKDRPEAITVGTHGLIIARGQHHGLLLPQVATERNWDAETFLTATCRKAGLPEDAWQDSKTDCQRFTAAVFAEDSPNGPLVRRSLGGDSP